MKCQPFGRSNTRELSMLLRSPQLNSIQMIMGAASAARSSGLVVMFLRREKNFQPQLVAMFRLKFNFYLD
jgi:hypothetical protein